MTKNKQKEVKGEFEFCKVCNLNHDQGRRHIYFPNHIKNLSSFLSRFKSKLSDVLFFLENPTRLLPEHASRNRIWCVFCDFDIDELGSFFACSNAIKHFSSTDHQRSLKHFMWKYGGMMDGMDIYRISEDDLSKWERQCKTLEVKAEESCRHLSDLSNDIHDKLKYENVENSDKNAIYSHKTGLSISPVMPLPNHTNERYQIPQSELSRVGSHQHTVGSLLSGVHSCEKSSSSKELIVFRNTDGSTLCNGRKCSANGYHSGTRLFQVHQDGVFEEQSNSSGLHEISGLRSMDMKEAQGNVHSGAPPPWLDAAEVNLQNFQRSPELGNHVSSKIRKLPKLNPKRVGAAWAEKRKMEMEMEKHGEITGDKFGDDWLPNFGRVWQSGSRKESRKEFEPEKQKLLKDGIQSEISFELQPYISKRMRWDVQQ